LRLYHYQYDDLNRMTSGNYIREGGNYHNSFLETLEYDKNGNITNLYRNGDNDAVDYVYPIDELKYYYHPQKPNQLMKVEDGTNSPQGFKDGVNTGDDYTYDANGNMTSDQNKNIENISYNHLNLPTKIFFGDGNQIIYLYNATGQKLSKVVQAAEEIRTDYLTGFQYHKQELNFFPHAEGYVSVVEGRFKYVFNYTDHLGNIRLSYSDANGVNNIQQEEILEESNYYPFGLKHTAYNTTQKKYIRDEELNELILSFFPRFAGDGRYNYKFQNKEWQDELGLNTYDFGARGYMPDIVRTPTLDPLAEKFYSFSPYSFLNNNPLRFVDPDGKQSIDFNKFNRNENSNSGFSDGPQYIASTVVDNRGKIIDHKDDGDDNIYLNKRGGIVVGKERKGVEYTPGKTVRRADLLEDFNYINGVITDVSRINAEKKAGKNPNAQIHNCPVCSARRCNGASHTNIRRATNSGVAGVATRGAIITTTASTYVYGWSGFLSGLFLGFSTGYGDDVFNQYDEYNAELEKEKDKK